MHAYSYEVIQALKSWLMQVFDVMADAGLDAITQVFDVMADAGFAPLPIKIQSMCEVDWSSTKDKRCAMRSTALN